MLARQRRAFLRGKWTADVDTKKKHQILIVLHMMIKMFFHRDNFRGNVVLYMLLMITNIMLIYQFLYKLAVAMWEKHFQSAGRLCLGYMLVSKA